MLTDELLPQPFRFLNQIVRQVVEDAIDTAVQREAALTNVKRMRVPKDIVQLPLMTNACSFSHSGGGGGGGANNNNAGAEVVSSAGGEEAADVRAADRMTAGTAKTKNSKADNANNNNGGGTAPAAASSNLPPFITAVGDAGAVLVLARNGTFTARDATLPDDDDLDDTDVAGMHTIMTAPIPGTVGEVTPVPVAADAVAPQGQNPSLLVVGCLPFAPGEEVAAACISSATGAVAVATAFSAQLLSGTASASASGGGGGSTPAAVPGTPASGNPLAGGGPATAAAAAGGGAAQDAAGGAGTAVDMTPAGCGGRLLLYSSIPPATAAQQLRDGDGARPLRRGALSKLTANQPPDFAVLLPQGCTATRIEISADEQFVAVVVVPNNNNNSSSNSSAGGTPEVLVYRKIQPQDCFYGVPGYSTAAGSPTTAAFGTFSSTESSAALLQQQQQQQQQSATRIQLPPQCETTLVLLGAVSPPGYAAASSSVPPSAVCPMPFFLFRPVEAREPHEHPVVCHTLLVAWAGYNVFSTVPLAAQSVEQQLGAPEVMRGSALDFAALASAAIANAVAAVTPPIVQTLTSSLSFRRAPANANNNSSGGDAATGFGLASATSNLASQQQQPQPHVVPPLPPLVPLCTGIDASRHAIHRPLPQIITTATLCRLSSRVALGLAEGVVGVWTHEPPCFSTIAVAAPHRSDSVLPTRRPMIVSSVSFYRRTHLVAALSVPVQIRSVEGDLPSVHYSRAVVIELTTGSVIATVPHVPALSLAVALSDMPLLLLYSGGGGGGGGNNSSSSGSFWVASVYTGELLAEIPCTVGAVARALAPPQTVAGKPLVAFCNSVQLSTRTCPFTGSFYGVMCCPGAASSSSSSSSWFFRVDGVSLAAGLRPMQAKRDEVLRSVRNVGQVAALLSHALIARAGAKDAEAAAMSISTQQQRQQQQQQSGGRAVAVAGSTASVVSPAVATAAAATAALALGFSEADAVLAALAAGSRAAGARRRKAGGGGGASRLRKSGGGVDGADEYSSADENTTQMLLPQPPTALSLGARSTVAASSYYAGSNFDGASTIARGGGGAESSSPQYLLNGTVLGAINERVLPIPIDEISKKLVAGRTERGRKVDKMLDELLAFAQQGVTVIGK